MRNLRTIVPPSGQSRRGAASEGTTPSSLRRHGRASSPCRNRACLTDRSHHPRPQEGDRYTRRRHFVLPRSSRRGSSWALMPPPAPRQYIVDRPLASYGQIGTQYRSAIVAIFFSAEMSPVQITSGSWYFARTDLVAMLAALPARAWCGFRATNLA